MSKLPLKNNNPHLFEEIKKLIDEAKSKVAQTVNAGLTTTYWNIGKRIKDDILKNKRTEYGKQIVATLSQQLMDEYGKGWSVKQLQHCLHSVETFPDFQIVSTLWRQLNWTLFYIFMLKMNGGMSNLQDIRNFRISAESTKLLQFPIEGKLEVT